MFSHRTRARPHGEHLGRRIGAAITTLTLGGAFALAGAGSASAAPGDDHVSWAMAQFLSGSVLGADLNTVASVEPAEAWNDGDDPTMTEKDPLSVKALQAVEVGDGDSVQVNTAGVQAGVLGQFASASADARSYAAAGAVLDDGGIGIGEDVALPGADATVSLGGILGSQFADQPRRSRPGDQGDRGRGGGRTARTRWATTTSPARCWNCGAPRSRS